MVGSVGEKAVDAADWCSFENRPLAAEEGHYHHQCRQAVAKQHPLRRHYAERTGESEVLGAGDDGGSIRLGLRGN